jgi:hypothetical protein
VGVSCPRILSRSSVSSPLKRCPRFQVGGVLESADPGTGPVHFSSAGVFAFRERQRNRPVFHHVMGRRPLAGPSSCLELSHGAEH